MKTFNPHSQITICEKKELAYFGDFPELITLNRVYGSTTAMQWLIPQLWDLAEYAGCRDKFTEGQILTCASVIASRYYYLKVSELMMFFLDFKAGKFGVFYGSVDPLKITTSLQVFCKNRIEIIAQHERDLAAMQREKDKKNAVSYEQWKNHKI